MHKTLPILPLGMLGVCLLAGCSPMNAYDAIKGKQAAEDAVNAFHQSLDKGESAKIYDASDPDLKAAPRSKDFTPLLAAVHRKLGVVQSSTQAGYNVSTFNLQTHIMINYETKFADGNGRESFNYRISGGKATLVGYNISSLDLILK